jgi:Na+/H+-dicarboxylate symporter
MIRTATNVAGQALIPVLVSARENLLDRDAYATADGSDLALDDEPRDARPERVPAAA